MSEARRNIPSPGGVLPNKTIYEQIQVGNSTQYAMKIGDKIVVEPMLTIGESTTYQPLSPSSWLLPGKPIPYGTTEELWSEVRGFIWDHLDIEIDGLYDVMTAWVLVSWVIDRFDSIGYLHFHGPKNSGKTRGLDLLQYLCFRPLLSPSASGAALFRALDAYHPTFLLDEFEMYEAMKESKAEILGIVNAGYRRGQTVLRITGMKEGNPILKGFNVFGPKALSSIEPLPPSLSSRCILFPMTKAYRKVRVLIDKERAGELRSKLLNYRFDHLFDEPSEDSSIDLPDGRLIEMYYPLKEVAPTEKIKDAILKCGRRQYNASVEEDRATIEAQVFGLVIDMLEEKPVLEIPQSEIRQRFNVGITNPKEGIGNRRLGTVLDRLNFASKTVKLGGKRRKAIVVDPDVLERRKNRYYLVEELKHVDEVIGKVKAIAKNSGLASISAILENGQKYLHPAEQPSFASPATILPASRNGLCSPASIASITSTLGGVGSPSADIKGEVAKVDAIDVIGAIGAIAEIDANNVFQPVSDVNLREKLETVSEVLRGNKSALSAEEIAGTVGLGTEETERLLEVIRRDGHAFQVPGGKWRWVA